VNGALAFLLPPAVAMAGLRLDRIVLGAEAERRLPSGLRLALGLAVGMLVFSQALLLAAIAGVNASRWLAWGALLWGGVEIALRAPGWTRQLRLPKRHLSQLWWLLLWPALYAAWVFARLSTQEGTLEFDGHAFWVFKAKMLYLAQGAALADLLRQSSLAYAHLDYPMLVPGLYTLTYGLVGGVDEFVCKVWPFWMMVALCLGVLSLGNVWTRPRPLPILTVLVLCFAPASLQFIRSEGGTMPMVFFVSVATLLLQRAMSAADGTALAAAVLALAGCAMTKLEGALYAALWLCVLVALAWRRGWLRPWPRRWWLRRHLLLSAASVLPYIAYRLLRPMPHPESGWLQAGLAAPGDTLRRFPQVWFLNVAGRFFRPDFFHWQSADGDHLAWAGQWSGASSLVNDQLATLPWLLLILLGLALWRRRSRLAVECLALVTLAELSLLSLVIACLPRMQRHLPRVIEFSAALQVGRYSYPFLLALFLSAAVAWFDATDVVR